MEIILIWILTFLIPVFAWGGYFDLLVDGVCGLSDDFKQWLRGVPDYRGKVYPYLVPDHERNEGDDSKRKVVPLAWLMRRVEDDPFMTESEWELRQWCEEHRDALNEFARAVESAGYSMDDYNPRWFVIRGDDAGSD